MPTTPRTIAGATYEHLTEPRRAIVAAEVDGSVIYSSEELNDHDRWITLQKNIRRPVDAFLAEYVPQVEV